MTEDAQINIVFKVTSNANEVYQEAVSTSKEADASAVTAEAKVSSLNDKVVDTQQNVSVLSDQLVKQIVAVNAVSSGVIGMNNALIQTGIISENAAQKVQLINSGIQLFTQSLNIVKGLQLVMETLKGSSIALSIAETYRSAISNPANLAYIGAAIGVAGVVGGSLIALTSQNNNSSSTATTTNITVNGGTTAETQTAVDVGMVTFR